MHMYIEGGVGMFMPYDKGLQPISDGTPWALQGAFMSAFFYHTVIHDKTGPVGMIVRNVVGNLDVDIYIDVYIYVVVFLLVY